MVLWDVAVYNAPFCTCKTNPKQNTCAVVNFSGPNDMLSRFYSVSPLYFDFFFSFSFMFKGHFISVVLIPINEAHHLHGYDSCFMVSNTTLLHTSLCIVSK